jgi:hypothetical protein
VLDQELKRCLDCIVCLAAANSNSMPRHQSANRATNDLHCPETSCQRFMDKASSLRIQYFPLTSTYVYTLPDDMTSPTTSYRTYRCSMARCATVNMRAKKAEPRAEKMVCQTPATPQALAVAMHLLAPVSGAGTSPFSVTPRTHCAKLLQGWHA